MFANSLGNAFGPNVKQAWRTPAKTTRIPNTLGIQRNPEKNIGKRTTTPGNVLESQQTKETQNAEDTAHAPTGSSSSS